MVLYILIFMLLDNKLEDRKFYWCHKFGQNPFLPAKNKHAAKSSVNHNSFLQNYVGGGGFLLPQEHKK